MTRMLFVVGFTLLSLGAAPQQQGVNPFAQAQVDFKQRVGDYMKLRDAITRKIPEVKETGDPAKIHSREKALGEAIAMARVNAMPGDIFGADMVGYFKKTLA